MKKILVTGAAGFLGSHLSEQLSNLGHEVVGIDNMLGGYEDNVPKNIEFSKTLVFCNDFIILDNFCNDCLLQKTACIFIFSLFGNYRFQKVEFFCRFQHGFIALSLKNCIEKLKHVQMIMKSAEKMC